MAWTFFNPAVNINLFVVNFKEMIHSVAIGDSENVCAADLK